MKKTGLVLLIALCNFISQAQQQRSFFDPYGKDWFMELRPQDRSVSTALISAVRNLLGKDSLRQVSMSIVPNPANTRPNLYIVIAQLAPPNTLETYMLSYDLGSNTYLAVAQKYDGRPPQVFLTFPGAGQITSINVDINGDGQPDRIEGSLGTASGYNPFNPPSLEANIKIYITTDVGQIDDRKLAAAVFDYRIGYIAGYNSSFNSALTKTPLPKLNAEPSQDSAPVAVSATSQAKIPAVPANQPLEQELGYDQTAVCTRYEDLASRKFLDSYRNQWLLIGLRRGFNQGALDAQDIQAKIKALTSLNVSQVNTKSGDAAANQAVAAYAKQGADLFYGILDKPVYRITFKNRKTGETVKLIDLIRNKEVDIPPISPDSSSLPAFIAKMTRPVTSAKSAPFFKPFDTAGDWYLLNPAMLSGQVTAYVNILAIVNSKDFLTQLQAHTDGASDFWGSLTDQFQQNLTNYSTGDVTRLSKSWIGISSLEFREGYRDVSAFIQRANTEVSRAQGSEDAVKDIIAFMKANYPQFNPPGDITTPAQAEAAIGGFVNGLYGTINQLDVTINNLNALLVNANNTITQLQGTIKKLDSAAGNIDRFTNVLANTAEVFYWGSSVGVAHSIGSWISNWF